jgi:hypothetical protein
MYPWLKVCRFLRGWFSIWPGLSLAWIMGVCLARSENVYDNIMVLIAHPLVTEIGADFGIKRALIQFVELTLWWALAAFLIVTIVALAGPFVYLSTKETILDAKEVIVAVR